MLVLINQFHNLVNYIIIGSSKQWLKSFVTEKIDPIVSPLDSGKLWGNLLLWKAKMEFVDPVNMDSDYTLGLDNIYPVDEDERLSPKLCSVDMTLEFKNGTFLLKGKNFSLSGPIGTVWPEKFAKCL